MIRFLAWMDRNWPLVAAILCALMALTLLSGCARTESRDTDQKRNLRRETVEVRQEIAPSGQVVQLTTKTITTETEQTAGQESARIEVEAPKVLDTLKPLAQAAATAVMGPAGGAAVNYLWETVAGLGAAGTTAGVGMVIRERTRRRKFLKAQDDYARDLEDAETDEEVERVKAKHRERQQALGIHEQLTRERHGA